MSNGYTIPSLQRGIRIIEAILAAEDGLTPMELEEQFAIPKTTIFRILYTLQNEYWVRKVGERYKAGHRLIQSSMEAMSGIELRSIAKPYLEMLSRETGETSHLGVWAGKKVMLAEVCDGSRHIRVSSRAGSLLGTYYSSLGKVLLAYCIGSSNIKEFYDGDTLEKFTPTTITNLDDLAAELHTVKEQGFGIDNSEFNENVRCLAAPVRNSFGSVVAALGITATKLTFPEEKNLETAREVIKVADELSLALGWIPE